GISRQIFFAKPLMFFSKSAIFFTICAEKVCYKLALCASKSITGLRAAFGLAVRTNLCARIGA
ncbi:MAG: hypothetical protein ACI3X6_01600, partial [Alloprevotella sp.]